MIETKIILLRKMRQKYIMRKDNNQKKLKVHPVKKLMRDLKEETRNS